MRVIIVYCRFSVAERDVVTGIETVTAVVRQIRLPGRGRSAHAAGEGQHGKGRRHVRVQGVQPLRDGERGKGRTGGLAAGLLRAQGRETGDYCVETERPDERGGRRRHYRDAQSGRRTETQRYIRFFIIIIIIISLMTFNL